jgi:membrane fusion protein (multidrug efflux system)
MIPQSAVQSDQQGDFVMIIVDDNKVKRINVKLGKRVDTLVIVEDGLAVDQVLVIRGVQKIRSGQQVKTKFAVAPTSDADTSANNH